MIDDLERKLRASLHVGLPAAPPTTRVFLERLPLDHPRARARIGTGRTALAAAATLFVGVSIVAIASIGGLNGIVEPPENVAPPPINPFPSPAVSPSPSLLAPSAIPGRLAGRNAYSVSELLALRSTGRIGGNQVALRGFWSDRSFGHSCVPPETPPGELQLRCHDGEWGITERDEPIATLTVDLRFVPHAGPALTPFVDEALAQRLFTLPYINGQPYPPVPIVVVGHFDDARVDDCQPDARQLCRDRFVIDEIVEFDPQAVPTPGVTPSPTPFPFDDPPPAPFDAAQCAGNVPYSFIGWGRLSEYGLDIGGDEVVFLVVTRDKQKPSGRKLCWANERDQGYAATSVP